MATIQVAETLELRETLAGAQILIVHTLWRQAAAGCGDRGWWWSSSCSVPRKPVRRTVADHALEHATRERPLPTAPLRRRTARAAAPVGCNQRSTWQRLSHLLEHQKRFVRDTSHQLRTPLAVLKTQVQIGAPWRCTSPSKRWKKSATTVERATELANQMLALAKVEQLRQQGLQGDTPVEAWDEIVRAVALDLSPLIAAGGIDFDIETAPAAVRGHVWALRELARNLLHNAVKHTPAGGRLSVRLAVDGAQATLQVLDSGPGLPAEQRQRLFQPFAASGPMGGSGLGLAICHEIATSLGGTIHIDNRPGEPGLQALVRLPLAR